MIDLRYIALRNLAFIRRKVMDLPSGADSTDDRKIIHQGCRVETSEAICLPGETDRARSSVPSSDMATQRLWAAAGILDHGPTVAYRLPRAIIAGDDVYTNRSFDRYGNKAPPFWPSDCVTLAEGALCESGGARFFGHWLCDNLCTELLAAEMGVVPVSLPPRWAHEPGYRDASGIRSTSADIMAVEQLWLLDDRGYNFNRIARFQNLRTLIRQPVDKCASKMVYIARGSTGTKRNLVNDSEVQNTLQAKGFVLLEPEKSSPQQIIEILSNASLIVSIEGSAICHALASLPQKSGCIIIQPPDHFNIFNKIIGDFCDITTGFVVAEPYVDGFRVDVRRLLKTIDLVFAKL